MYSIAIIPITSLPACPGVCGFVLRQPVLCRHQAGTTGQHRVPAGNIEKKHILLLCSQAPLKSKTVARTNTTRQYLASAEQVLRLEYSPLGRAGCGQRCSALGAVGEERSISLNSRGLRDKC